MSRRPYHVLLRASFLVGFFACTVAMGRAAGAATVVLPVDGELAASGRNYDDICFWRNPADVDASLAFVTSKDLGIVEAFDLGTGRLVGSISGLARPNNCDVSGDWLVTTDSDSRTILVHRIPDLALVRSLGSLTFSPFGVGALRETGRALVFVTAENGDVHAYELPSLQSVRTFASGLSPQEAVATDELYQRVIITQDEGADGVARAFSTRGELVAEFGREEIEADGEGIAVYRCGTRGWVVVSDQRLGARNSEFEVFDRRTFAYVGTFALQSATDPADFTNDTDGIDVFQTPTARFPSGVFAACDGCTASGNTFDLVGWERIAAALSLEVCPDGRPAGCGDGVLDAADEQCDGASDAACPGQCAADCTCAPAQPRCGDGLVNQAAEECDGADDEACPAECAGDCTCPPACGDEVVDLSTEECDGTDDDACPGLCLPDCRCGAAPAGSLVENGGFENGQVGWQDWSSTANRGEVVRTSTGACAGAWAAQMFDSSTRTRAIWQDVGPVVGGRVYALGVVVRTKNLGSNQGRVVVQWRSGAAALRDDLVVVSPGTRACAALGAQFTAPPGATAARIVLQLLPVTNGVPANDAEVWYDEVRFDVAGGAPPTTTTIATTTTTRQTTTTTVQSATTTTSRPTTTTTATSTTTTQPGATTTTLPAPRRDVLVDIELTASGLNYDDPCLWQDDSDPAKALACITSKDAHVIDCWELPSRTFRGTAGGGEFGAGESPNNCDMDARRSEMVATDRGNDRILVFDLTLIRAQGAAGDATSVRAVSGADMTDPTGVCVGHVGAASLIFITNDATDEVLVYDSLTGAFVRKWAHGFARAEGIACDDDYQRVVVCQDEGQGGMCRSWSYDGAVAGPIFGASVFGSDAEGVALYRCDATTGYLFVSDQENDEFEIFDRAAPFTHRCTFTMHDASGRDRTDSTDGIDVLRSSAFPAGIFAACDSCSGTGDELDLALTVDDILADCGLPLCGAPSTTTTTLATTTTTTLVTTTTSTTIRATTTTTTLPPTGSLLLNGSFEDGQTGWQDWASTQNSGEAVRASTGACDGGWAVHMFDSSTRTRAIYQDVGPIVSGGAYGLSAVARTRNLGTAQGRIVVQWRNGTTLLREDAVSIAPGTAPCASYAAQLVAPSAATSARIVLQLLPVTNGVPANDAEVWFDAVSFGLVGSGSGPPTTVAPASTTTTTRATATTTTLAPPPAAEETIIELSPLPASARTGEKPQSKLWQHDGSWWAVMPSTAVTPAGTWIWRLGADHAWTNVLRISGSTAAKADVELVGEVAHVLLHDSTPALVSVEYLADEHTYAPWSSRPAATPVALSGSETATIAVDSTGRLWLAADSSSAVMVHYSDPPYAAFAGPIVLHDGITRDDITLITALPDATVGVLWSNQRTARFGFRWHRDGADAQTWSADEIPAAQSALSAGTGMADDHLNVAVAADGTLYAAVKTNYDTAGLPRLGLLVRHPDGRWDDLRTIAGDGTRPNLLLNEVAGTLTVVYTSANGGGDIVMRESPLAPIGFGARRTLLQGHLDDATSTRLAWTDDVPILASDGIAARGVLIVRNRR